MCVCVGGERTGKERWKSDGGREIPEAAERCFYHPSETHTLTVPLHSHKETGNGTTLGRVCDAGNDHVPACVSVCMFGRVCPV